MRKVRTHHSISKGYLIQAILSKCSSGKSTKQKEHNFQTISKGKSTIKQPAAYSIMSSPTTPPNEQTRNLSNQTGLESDSNVEFIGVTPASVNQHSPATSNDDSDVEIIEVRPAAEVRLATTIIDLSSKESNEVTPTQSPRRRKRRKNNRNSQSQGSSNAARRLDYGTSPASNNENVIKSNRSLLRANRSILLEGPTDPSSTNANWVLAPSDSFRVTPGVQNTQLMGHLNGKYQESNWMPLNKLP